MWQAPQLQSDSKVSLSLPWTTSLNPGICGEILYQIFLDGEEHNDWVTLEDGEIVARPDLGVAPGVYTFQMVAVVDNMRNITAVQDFTVTVTNC